MKGTKTPKQLLALVLALIMLLGSMPVNVFAAYNLEMAPAKGPVGVKDAAPPEDTSTSADAKNAVHGFVGVLVHGDVNADLKATTGQGFKPIEGVKVYFQWFERTGNRTSPTYYATSGADGQFHIKMKPYIGEDGKLVKFDADNTILAGFESYKMWVDESTIPEGYQLQYSTGEGVEFTDRRVAGGGYQLGPNRLVNYRVLLMPKQDEEKMHKEATPTGPQIFGTKPGQGAVYGKVSWDYESAGGVQWGMVSTPTSPADGITVTASYLSDYALKKIFSADTANLLGVSKPSDIRGSGWTTRNEEQLQNWIAEQVEADKENWIAESVSAVTNAEGDYKIQFKGTWGPYRNTHKVAEYTRVAGRYYAGDAHRWTEEEVNRLGTVAENAEDGGFLTGALDWNEKHINSNWLYISIKDTDNVVKRTPWNYNWYTGSTTAEAKWGIHGGWAQTAFGVSTEQAANSSRADFNLAPAEIKFNITNFDTQLNTATPGDVATTNTQGLPYKSASDSFKIVWYDQDGNKIKEEPTQKPTSTGALAEATYDTKDVTETKTFIAKLHYVKPGGGLGQVLAQDAFTVKVNDKIGSRYEDVEFTNGKTEGATYAATGLPNGLTIDEATGKVTGKPTESGKFTVTTTISVPADDAEAEAISVEKIDEYIITDSPLKDGNVNSAYSETVKPTEVEGYVFKNVSAKFIDGKEIDGLTITGDQISGTPTAKVEATEEDPNVQVTYDIYKLNDKGEEVLIKKGHVDKVPLSIKDDESSKYEPEYTPVDGTVGTPATVAAPTFKDAEGKPATPENVTYKLGEGAPTGAEVKADGSVTYTPVEGDADKTVEIPVVVKYSDGSTDNVKAVINVAKNKTTADQVKELGGLNPQTIKVWKGDDIDWSKGVAPKTTSADDAAVVESLLANATVTENTTPARTSAEAVKKEGTLLVTFGDGSTLEVEKQWLYVWEHIVTVDPNSTDPDVPKTEDELPVKKVKVLFEPVRNRGVKFINTTGTTYAKEGTVFQDKDFPQDITFEDGYKGPVTWTPASHTVSMDSRKGYDKRKSAFVFKASATMIEYTDDEIIPYTPDEDEPTKGDDGKDIPDNYITVTFKSEDENKGTVKVETKEGAEVKAKVKPGTNLAGKAEAIAKDGYGFTVWAPELGVAADGNEYVAKFIKSGDEVKPNDPIPTGWFRVTVKQDNTIEAGTVTEKTYAVEPNDKLAADKFPSLEGKAADKYENPAWYKDAETKATADPSAVEITADTTFTAKATAKSGTPSTADKDKYDPKYEDKSGKPGETVQIDPPTFTKTGVTGNVPAPTGTTFAKNDNTQTNVTIDPNTGAITVVIPQDAKVGDVITIPVDVTYPDRSNETVGVTVTVKDSEDKTEDPTIDQPYEGDNKITGKGEPESKIVVELPDGTQVDGDVDENGNWTVDVPADKPLKPGDVIKATQTKDGESKETSTIVKARFSPEPKPEPRPLYPYIPLDFIFGPGSTEHTRPVEIVKTHEAYVKGYPEGDFRPEGKMTRAEAVTIIVRLEDYKLGSDKPMFADTVEGGWYNKFINAAYNMGILEEKAGEDFRPNDPITRGELARLISVVDKKSTAIAPFADVKGHKYETFINQAFGNQRILGYPDGTFRPDADITRAEVTAMINRLYDRKADDITFEKTENLYELKKFTDLTLGNHWAYFDIMEAANGHRYTRRNTKGDTVVENWKNIIVDIFE